MFYLRRPTPQTVASVLNKQGGLEPDYADAGVEPGFTHPARELQVPPGWSLDHHRARLGEGADVFRRARALLLAWQMYDNGWTTVTPQAAPAPGNTFVVTARHFGFYSLNAVQVIYRLDEPTRTSFAVGALPLHAERGEERFTVWTDEAGEVWFELLAVSTPKNPLVRLVSPLARGVQQRFFADAAAQMRVAVKNA